MAGVTHEVRNPLNAMTIHLELVREHLLRQQRSARAPVGAVLRLDGVGERSPEFDGAREHIDVIASEIKRLDEVITGFVRFIRPEELQVQPVDVKALINEVIALVEPDVRRNGVVCRAERLGRAARAARRSCLAPPGAVEPRAKRLPGHAKWRKTNHGGQPEKDRRIALTVEDTGIGIPADKLDRIFDLYFTTKPEGSGIGLSIVYRIVQLHGGEIEVQSTEGRGTTFRILLPLT